MFLGSGYAVGLIVGIVFWYFFVYRLLKKHRQGRITSIRQRINRIYKKKIEAKRAHMRERTQQLKDKRQKNNDP